MPVFDFSSVDRFVVGTIGLPGQRAFYLQARQNEAVVSIAVEKQQVAVLAERMDAVLDEVAPAESPAPGDPGAPPADTEPLETPVEELFRLATLTLLWDSARHVIVIECHDHDPDELSEPPDDDVPGFESDPFGGVQAERYTLRVFLQPVQARAFAQRTLAVVAAGPLDPGGHVCPRANGYRR